MEMDVKCERRGAEERLSVVCSNVARKFLFHECGARCPSPCYHTQTAHMAVPWMKAAILFYDPLGVRGGHY